MFIRPTEISANQIMKIIQLLYGEFDSINFCVSQKIVYEVFVIKIMYFCWYEAKENIIDVIIGKCLVHLLI